MILSIIFIFAKRFTVLLDLVAILNISYELFLSFIRFCRAFNEMLILIENGVYSKIIKFFELCRYAEKNVNCLK